MALMDSCSIGLREPSIVLVFLSKISREFLEDFREEKPIGSPALLVRWLGRADAPRLAAEKDSSCSLAKDIKHGSSPVLRRHRHIWEEGCVAV